MYTIVLATQKGGSGKSTLAIGLSLAAQEAGHNVRLIETDKQGTLSNWQSRRGLAEPIVEAVYDAKTIDQRLQALERGGVTLAVIDTASGTNAVTAAAIRHCDLCIIPARPSVADIEATGATLGLARACGKPFAFVLNQIPVRGGHRVSDAASVLDQRAPRDLCEVLAQPFIAMRIDHQDALAAGLAVGEYAPTGKSATEIGELWQWIDDKLSGRMSAKEDITDAPTESPSPVMFVEAAPPLAAPGEIDSSWDACL
jgi:chromosome partitioning protein